MTTKEYSELMRQLGYIEGMVMAVDGDTGSALMDGLLMLGKMLEKLEVSMSNDYISRTDARPVWIPLTERLPEKDKDVLVCTKGYGLHILGFVMVASWNGEDFIESWSKETELYGVSHWMLLPEPPARGTDG